jgi:hypothetical protein
MGQRAVLYSAKYFVYIERRALVAALVARPAGAGGIAWACSERD